jgi:MFS family permease
MSDERIFWSGQKPPAQPKQSALPKQERPVPDLKIPQPERQIPDLKIDKSKSGEEGIIEVLRGLAIVGGGIIGVFLIGGFIANYIQNGWRQEDKGLLIFGLVCLAIAVLAYKYPIYRAKYQIRFHQTKDPRTTPAMRAVLQIWLNENLPAQIDLEPDNVPPLIEKMYAWLLALATKCPHYPADRLHRRFMAAWAQFFVDGKNAKEPALP